jgi:hypothetical protein
MVVGGAASVLMRWTRIGPLAAAVSSTLLALLRLH